MFFGYTQTNQFSIQMNRSDKEDSILTIKKIADDTAYFNTNQDTLTGILNQGIDPQHIEDYFYALESSYQIGNQKSTGKYAFRKEGIQYISASTPNMFKGPLTKVLFFSSKTVPSNNLIAEWFSRLNLRGDKSQILNILKIFDPEIADIFTVIDSDSPSLYIQFTDHSHMPLSILGDGINKATQILLCILTTPNGIVLIDEIENGFHYSVYPKVLNAFYEAALKSNTQLIITTHNADILRTSADVMRSKNKLDHLAYDRIDFSQNRRRAFSFTGKELYHALDAELEVR